MEQNIRVLIVEDFSSDATLAKHEIEKVLKNFIAKVVDNEKEYLEALDKFNPDLIISDYSLPAFDGMTALNFAIKKSSLTPFIVLTGSMNEETAVECMKAGATDYVIKEHIKRLGPAVLSALHQKEIRKEKVQAESLLKESEEKFRRLAENAQDIIFRYELIPKRRLTYINSSVINILGYTPEEFYYDPELEIKIIYPEDCQLLDKCLTGENAFREPITLRYIKKDGTIIWTEQRRIPIYDTSKVMIAYEGITRDITESKLAMEKIFESEEKFRTIFNTSYEGICVSDFNNKINFVNPRMAELTGYSVDELITMNFRSLLPAEELIDHEKKGKNRIQGNSEIYERRFLRKDGSIIWTFVSASPVYDKDGNYNGSFGMFTDITKLKATTIEFRKFYLGVEQNPTIVMITYLDGKIEYVNPKFSEVSGYTFEETVGKYPNILKSGLKSSAEYKELWNTILSGKSWHGEFMNRKKNGELYWESAVISPIVDDNGKIINFIAIKQDITERKKMIEEIIKEKEKALASEKIKTEFLAQMSHEVRTPMNIITGNIAILKSEICGKYEDSLCDLFDGIELSSTRIIRTIDLILNMTELQTGVFKPIFKKIDLKSDVLLHLVNEFQLESKRRNLELSFSLNASYTIVIADEYCMTQIFSNLIDNSLKYTKNGKVEIILCNNKSGDIIVEVKDTGIGISQDFMKHLFEPFVQEEHGYTRSFDGNGLGLALIKKYCDINNAKIEVESEKNIGSTFRIIFQKPEINK